MTSIHWLGAHKTATTFLQKSLDRSSDLLEGHDVLYMELDEFRERYTRPLLKSRPERDPDPTVFDGDHATTLVFDENIPGLVQQALQETGFYPQMIERFQRILDHLHLDVDEIVFGVRDYSTYLPSLYCETLKSTPFRTFEQYLRQSFAGSSGFERMNWYGLLRRLVDAYPTSQVRVYFHEDLRGHEAQLLGEVLAIPADDFTLITTSERVGFSGAAVTELNEINRRRTVERKDVRAAVKRFPRADGHATFDPWDDEQRLALQTAYERDRAWIMGDPALEVIHLGDELANLPRVSTTPGAIDLVPPEEPEEPAEPGEAGDAPEDAPSSPPPEPDLSIVVPVHDAQETITTLVEHLLAIQELRIQVVLVDDASGDDSPAIIDQLATSDQVLAFHHQHNRGAGIARNTGFRAVTGRYCLFFDADDVIHPEALVAAVAELDETGADIAMMPYYYRREKQPTNTAMNTYDVATWDKYVGDAFRRVGTLDKLPRLLGFSNYPWNKVLRTDTYRRVGLRFGSTPVHNDILGHWYSLLFAHTIVLVNREVCTHVVGTTDHNLTNRQSEVRLSLFDALDETYDLLEAHPALRDRYSHHYWAIVVRVAGWASNRIDARHRHEFKARLRQHLLRANLADYTRIRLRRDPDLADAILHKALS